MAGRDRPWRGLRGQASGELRAALFLAASVALFFWPVWLTGYTFPPGGGDLWGQLYPVWANVARYLYQGTFPMWLPQLMAGDPIIGDLQYGLLNPLNWWLFALPTLPRWAVLLRGMLPLWLAGYGLYRYLRRSPVWRLSTPASLTGAIAYMFSDTFIIHLGHPHIIDVIAWLPWALLAVDRTLEHHRWSLRPSLPIALMVVAGHYQMIGYNAMVITLYALWRVAQRPPETWLRSVRRLGIVALCALALTLPALLPSFERYPFTERSVLEVKPWRGYQWTPAQAVDWIAPDFHGRSVRTFWGSWARVESGYTGVVALTLAVIGAAANIRRPRGWFVLLLGTFAVLLALGYAGPLFPQLARIELMARMSKTARAIYLFSLAVAMAASLGVQALWDTRHTWPWMIMLTVLVAAGWLWMLAPRWAEMAPTPESQQRALESLRLAAAMAGATAPLGWLSKRGRFGQAGLVLLLLGELVATGALAEVEPASPPSSSPVFAYLRGDEGWFRVDVDAKARGLMSPAVLQGQGFEVPTTNGNPMEMAAYTQFYWAVPHKGAPMYQLFGAKYIIVPKGALPGGEGIWPVFDGDPHVDVHLNTNAMNRIWLVYRTHPVISFEEAFTFVREDTFDPQTIAVVENGPRLDAKGKGWLEVLVYNPNRVRFGVHTSATAMLVLSDFLYPGWRGYVDGEPTPIYRADGIFRGVVVPPGDHVVEMRFRPLSFIVGLWAAAMATVLYLAELLRGLTSVSGTL